MEREDCIFCKIANGQIPSATIYEDEDFRVILDLGPASRGHALILPKSHSRDLCDAQNAVTEKILPLAGKIGSAMKSTLGATGFNVVQNNGASGGQTVFHLHVHIIPRYEDGPTMVSWSPHKLEEGELEETANLLRAKLQ